MMKNNDPRLDMGRVWFAGMPRPIFSEEKN